MKKLLALTAALLLLIQLTACTVADLMPAASSEPESYIPEGAAVEVQTVERGDLFTENDVTGNVMANRDVPALSKIACKVKEVRVKAGQMVKEGDVLFVLDTDDIQDLYGTLLENYDGTATLLDEQIRQTQQSLDNLTALYEIGAVAWTQVEQAQLGLMQAENSKKTTLDQMGVDDVKEVLEDPAVTAPISGTVTSVAVTAGSMVTTTNPAVVVSEIGKPQAVVNVSEDLVPQIRAGNKVSVTIPALNNGTVSGVVDAVAATISPNTALYEVRINIPASPRPSIGMMAKATFLTDARYGAVLVPTEAILNDGVTPYVYTVIDGAAYRTDVTTGLVGETQTEITSGLNGGEQLVTRGQSYLSDGAPVRVIQPADTASEPEHDPDTEAAAG